MPPKFTCEICHKSFSRKYNLNLHKKRKHYKRLGHRKVTCPKCDYKTLDLQAHMSLLHSDKNTCVICPYKGKTIQDLHEHEELRHKGDFKCIECGKNFTNEGQMHRHIHECLETDINLLDDDIREVYEDNVFSIKTHTHRGNITDWYNVRWRVGLSNIPPDWETTLWRLFRDQERKFKINFSHSFILQDKESKDYSFFHSNYLNHLALKKTVTIKSHTDMKKFIESVVDTDHLNIVQNERRETGDRVVLIPATTFYVTRLDPFPIGDDERIPQELTRRQGLRSFHQRNRAKSNCKRNTEKAGLCFFQCLSFYLHGTAKHAETLFKKWKGYLPDPGFRGVTMIDIDSLETCFDIAIDIYTYSDDTFTLLSIRRHGQVRNDTRLKLLKYKQHFMLITNLDSLCNAYTCPKCSKIFQRSCKMLRHKANCDGSGVRHYYPGGVYKRPSTIFDDLRRYGFQDVPNFFCHPFRATWDLEAYFDKRDLPQCKKENAKTVFLARHRILSAAAVTNVPGFTEAVCFINNGSEEMVIENLVTHLQQASFRSYEILKQHFSHIYDQFQNVKNTQEHSDEHENIPVAKLEAEFDKYLKQLNVCAFNQSYDINLCKEILMGYLMKKRRQTGEDIVQYVIKKGNAFICISLEYLRFLDIMNYLPPGFSLQQYLKCFKASASKGQFCYEYIDSLERLDETLPPHEKFYSKLKRKNISKEEYEDCCNVWKQLKMKTLRDFLRYYMLLDTVPFLEALNNQVKIYADFGIDFLKVAVSAPGISSYFAFKRLDPTIFFSLTSERFKDIHSKLRSSLVGGPSLMYERLALSGITQLSKGKICQSVFGWDCNSLYLYAISKNDCPTGFPIVRRKENDFVPEFTEKYGIQAREWLEWVSHSQNRDIQHKFNNGERRLGSRKIAVDGFDAKHGVIYQFHGCLIHGHVCRLTEEFDVCPISKKDLMEKQKDTKEISEYLRTIHGIKDVIEIYECQWQDIKHSNSEVSEFVKKISPPRPVSFREKEINDKSVCKAIIEGSLYGMVLCDVFVPDHLKDNFSTYQPIFKNVEIGIDDIGPYMKKYAEERGLLKKKRRCLVGSYFVEQELICTPLLRWYLTHGFQVRNVDLIVEYVPQRCFEKFGQICSDMRREGDLDPSKKPLASAAKLIQNSLYGKSITNKSAFKTITYQHPDDAFDFINNPLFRQAKEITDEVVEIELFKKNVVWDLPFQMGFMVYANAKVRLLEFYYDFLMKYFDPSDLKLLETDTDSLYFACSYENFENAVKPGLWEEFKIERSAWLVKDHCTRHSARNDECADCLYDLKTPGLFKIEFHGRNFVGLCSKTYYCQSNTEEDKARCKGLSTSGNKVTFDDYLNVLQYRKAGGGTNIGFRSDGKNVYTYQQQREALSYFYIKRPVFDDGYTTGPCLL